MSFDYNNPRWKAASYANKIMFNFTCALCGLKGNGKLVSHHIVPVPMCRPHQLYSQANLVTLCEYPCHMGIVHADQDSWKQYKDIFQRKNRAVLDEKKNLDQRIYTKNHKTKGRTKSALVSKTKVKKFRGHPRGLM